MFFWHVETEASAEKKYMHIPLHTYTEEEHLHGGHCSTIL